LSARGIAVVQQTQAFQLHVNLARIIK
jgi:hypothetical protein